MDSDKRRKDSYFPPGEALRRGVRGVGQKKPALVAGDYAAGTSCRPPLLRCMHEKSPHDCELGGQELGLDDADAATLVRRGSDKDHVRNLVAQVDVDAA